LVIDSDSITIGIYDESQIDNDPKEPKDPNRLPFKGFPRGVPMRGYSEDGKIFIEYDNGKNGIPYIYHEGEGYPKTKTLKFTFGDREEILQKKEGN